MGGEQDRHQLVARQALDLVPELGAGLRVEARGRLVEEQDLRAVDEPHGQVEAALHPARVRLGLAVGGSGEAEALEGVSDAPAQVAAGDRVELALEDEVLAPGRLGVDPVLLRDDADGVAHAYGLGEHVDPRHARAAAVGSRKRGQDPHGRGLAGAVGTEQPEDGARLHG